MASSLYYDSKRVINFQNKYHFTFIILGHRYWRYKSVSDLVLDLFHQIPNSKVGESPLYGRAPHCNYQER